MNTDKQFLFFIFLISTMEPGSINPIEHQMGHIFSNELRNTINFYFEFYQTSKFLNILLA